MQLGPEVQLWEHQREMAEFAVGRNTCLLDAGCGVGKTLASLYASILVGARRVLVMTIKTAIRDVWENEINTMLVGAKAVPLHKGSSKDKSLLLQREYREDADITKFFIVNYETAKLINLSYPWDLVIADESHKLKGHGSAVSKDLARNLMMVPRKIAMTGTPFEDRPLDVYGQMRWLRPAKDSRGKLYAAGFGHWTTFFEQYATYYQRDNIKIPTGYKNLDKLRSKLEPYMLRIRREDVLDLPPVRHINRYAELTPSHRKVYEQLKKELALEYGDDYLIVGNPLVLALRLHEVAAGFYTSSVTGERVSIPKGDAKLEVLQGLVEELGGEPVVIYTRFKEDVSRISGMLNREGITYSVLTGSENQFGEWRDGKSQVLIANIQSGSAGLNMTRAAYLIYYTIGNNATDYTQSLYRVDRPGQTRPVTVYHILAKGTVDGSLTAAMGEKANWRDGLLGDMA